MSVKNIFMTNALNLLERMETKKATIVYLDPPWDIEFLSNLRISGKNDINHMEVYLDYFYKVVQQARRVLTQDGSLFFHVNTYLLGNIRNILDELFGIDNFRGEIIIPYHRIYMRNRYLSNYDVILYYSKSNYFKYNEPVRKLTIVEIKGKYPFSDNRGNYRLRSLFVSGYNPTLNFEWMGLLPPEGKHWRYSLSMLNELYKNKLIHIKNALKLYEKEYICNLKCPIGNIWDDILIHPQSKMNANHLGQQPVLLFDRIINMASEMNDLFIDPFCGSGTSLISAHKNIRKWIGSDISKESLTVCKDRLINEEGLIYETDFCVLGEEELKKQFPRKYKSVSRLKLLNRYNKINKLKLNEIMPIEETRYCEFKEIKGKNPVNTIKNQSDVYAVAFLNSSGGSIYWGVRDSDRAIVGVSLDYSKRDEIRRVVTEKLLNVQPSIPPTEYSLEFYEVLDSKYDIKDLYVVRLMIPKGKANQLYFTGGTEAYVRTDGGKRKLTGAEINEELYKRFNAR